MIRTALETQIRIELRRALRAATVALAAVLCAFAPMAAADVYKCIAAGGRVTYQQTPCTAGTTGGRTEIVTDNGSSRAGSKEERQWEDAANAKTVVIGMPRNYVLRALGQPPDVRAGSADENAAEVWSYAQGPNEVLRIGMTGGLVTWQRLEPSSAALAAAAAPQTHLVELRKNVVPGVSCDQVIADLGPADIDETDKVGQPPYRRLTWGATQEDPKGTMFVTCLAGLVTEARREAQ